MNPTFKRKEIASEILGEIHWSDDTCGYLRCPGIQHHTSKNHKQDCRIYVDQVPTVHCLHESCQDEIIKANRELRSAIGKEEAAHNVVVGKMPRAPIDPAKEALMRKALYLRRTLQADYGWSLAEIKGASNPPEHPAAQRLELFGLFDVFDIVWNGHLFESGKQCYSHRFKPLKDWFDLCYEEDPLDHKPAEFAPAFREFTVPSSFKGGTYIRGRDHIEARRFLVVESDTLSKDQVGAVFRWLGTQLRLRTIIDTGGKSLHGWFDYPADELLKELFLILPILGCDRKMFNPAQPCRMPGVIRQSTGRLQEMIYLDGGVR
jgi:hypothetical protein